MQRTPSYTSTPASVNLNTTALERSIFLIGGRSALYFFIIYGGRGLNPTRQPIYPLLAWALCKCRLPGIDARNSAHSRWHSRGRLRELQTGSNPRHTGSGVKLYLEVGWHEDGHFFVIYECHLEFSLCWPRSEGDHSCGVFLDRDGHLIDLHHFGRWGRRVALIGLAHG